MKISVLGLGYVGSVTAACFANSGHEVTGVDSNPTKVQLINQGIAPIVEAHLGELIAAGISSNTLCATMDTEQAITNSDISFVCVGTPSQPNGNLDLSYLEGVCQEIGAALRNKRDFHVIVIRSTVLPGTIRQLVIPTLERLTGKIAGIEFGVCNNPEFLREGSAIDDFLNPPKTVIGETDKRSGDILASLYTHIPGPVVRCEIEIGEIAKYVDNVWHAVKVSFANEVGRICKGLNLDSRAVMNIFCQDTKLNLSAYYLKPGFAYGGSCLPKDLRAINYLARSIDIAIPVINSVHLSNREQIELGIRQIIATGRKKVGILGFSFKSGTDDLRESPLVDVIEVLIGKGFDVRIYDINVNLSKIMGANRDYILNIIPHIGRIMVDDIDSLIEHAEIIVIGNASIPFKDLAKKMRADQLVLDLVGVKEPERQVPNYQGVCW